MYAKKCLELARTKYPNNENLRVAYMLGLNDGYGQGEEDLIEKACEWLKSYRQDTSDGTGYIAGVVNDKTIEDFKEYMEGE